MQNLLQLLNDHNRKMATAISIVLIVLMSLAVANTVLFLLEQQSQQDLDMIGLESPTQGNPRSKTYKVSDLELFGSLEATTVQQAVDAPETKLNLELQGIFIADDESQSTAIIGEKAKTGELYVIGDRLPGNATLAAVYDDHVLLRRGTRMEKLMFSDTRFTLSKDAGGSASRSGVAANSINAPGNSTGQSNSARDNLERIRDRIRDQSARPNSTGPDSLSGDGSTHALSSYRDRLAQDPAGALEEIGVSPISSDGADGYRVGADAPDVVKRAGIQPGDVVLSVNGRPVGNAASDSALMDQVMASSRVRVEVQRGSRRFFLTVPIPKQ